MPEHFTGPIRDNPVFGAPESGEDRRFDRLRPSPTAPDPGVGAGLKVGRPSLGGAEDPSLQASLRRQGASAARAREEIARRQVRLETNRERNLEQINEGAESRGLFRSSGADTNRSRLQSDFDLDLEELARQRARIGSGGASLAQLTAAAKRQSNLQTDLGFVPDGLFRPDRFREFIPAPSLTNPPPLRTDRRGRVIR